MDPAAFFGLREARGGGGSNASAGAAGGQYGSVSWRWSQEAREAAAARGHVERRFVPVADRHAFKEEGGAGEEIEASEKIRKCCSPSAALVVTSGATLSCVAAPKT